MAANGTASLVKDLRLFAILGITALALGLLLLEERSGLADRRAKAEELESRLIEARQVIALYEDVLLPRRDALLHPELLSEKSLRTVVTETAEKMGIAGNLEGVDPTEDRRTGAGKARVILRGVSMRQVVQFILSLKNLSAGIMDTEAVLRMQGYNADTWRLELGIEAPRPYRATNGHSQEGHDAAPKAK